MLRRAAMSVVARAAVVRTSAVAGSSASARVMGGVSVVRAMSAAPTPVIVTKPAYRPARTPEDMIASIPVIEVDGNVAVCNGGGGALGHPVEYIQLNTVKPGDAATCKYCGLRYKQKPHHH